MKNSINRKVSSRKVLNVRDSSVREDSAKSKIIKVPKRSNRLPNIPAKRLSNKASNSLPTSGVLASLGDQIRKQRKTRKLTQTQLAQLAGVGINFISQVESGKATAQIGLVIAVLKILGMELKLGVGKEGLRIE